MQQKGYRIIEKNFSCRQGELDIIAENKEFIYGLDKIMD